MRLLSTNADGSFSLTSFTGNNIPSYAILSHTWEADNQEVSFQDVCNATGSSKNGYRKIQFCAQQAENDGLQYFWVDSCSIDKSNNVELQEAVNVSIKKILFKVATIRRAALCDCGSCGICSSRSGF
jgi:hypothetical protein